MTNTDKRIAKQITKDFLGAGCISCGLGALEIAAGLKAAEDKSAVAQAVKVALEAKGVIVRGPGLRAS